MFMVSLWLEIALPRHARARHPTRIARRPSEAERAEAFFPRRSDNDDGGCQARSAPAMFAPPICRRSERSE